MANKIVDEFMASTRIPETPNGTLKEIMTFLTRPESVNKMIVMTEMGFPALTGVVKELEDKFADSDFPLNLNGPHANSVNRRNIGWMVKYVMREYGYTPKAENSTVRTRIGNFAGAKYFKTAARYERLRGIPPYEIVVTIKGNKAQECV